MITTMNTPRSLALVGMPGAGKTLCAKHLEQRGYFQYRFGSIIVDEVVHRGWTITPENERIVREEIRAKEGMDAIARRALPHLKTALASHHSVVIDGLYGFGEYKLLRQELGADMVVVAVLAPRWLRYSRLASRPERPLTASEAEARDYQEIEKLEKGGPIALADFYLHNDREPEATLSALDALVAELTFQP
jgi:dephospho-CoA kinase